MDAIINVNKESAYAHLNGLTFPVLELLNTMAVIDVNGVTTDFYFNEYLIVNIQEEYKNAYDNNSLIFTNLDCYVRLKKIKW